MKFYEFLSPERLPVPTPENVIDEMGRCHFGTFAGEFERMDFHKAKKPTTLPNFMNRTRLTEWEAAEINFDEFVLLTAVCDMFYAATSLTILYDKRTKTCRSWQETLIPHTKAVIANNLLRGSKTFADKKVKVSFVNNFEKGEARVSGCCNDNKSGKIKYNVHLTRVSKPSVVVIPFDDNRPLYSQKDLFSAEGYIEIDGKRYYSSAESTGIIDDHKGYYPRRSHYDWVTTLGKTDIGGKKEFFGFNLTRNQSIDHDRYNENLIWFEGNATRLTPVVFEHKHEKLWHIADDYGMVDIYFDIGDEFKLCLPAKIIEFDYHITFGELRGFVRDPDGKKYIIDGMTGIGEDKTLLF